MNTKLRSLNEVRESIFSLIHKNLDDITTTYDYVEQLVVYDEKLFSKKQQIKNVFGIECLERKELNKVGFGQKLTTPTKGFIQKKLFKSYENEDTYDEYAETLDYYVFMDETPNNVSKTDNPVSEDTSSDTNFSEHDNIQEDEECIAPSGGCTQWRQYKNDKGYDAIEEYNNPPDSVYGYDDGDIDFEEDAGADYGYLEDDPELLIESLKKTYGY